MPTLSARETGAAGGFGSTISSKPNLNSWLTGALSTSPTTSPQWSPVNDIEIKHLLKSALTDRISDREVYMKGIDNSYFYEGYKEYRTEDLRTE